MESAFKLFFLAVSNAFALWLASHLIDGFTFTQASWSTFLWIGLVLGLINSLLGSIVKLITLPIRLLTLGLFTVIINLSLLYLVDVMFQSFQIENFWAGIWGLFIISLTNYLISALVYD